MGLALNKVATYSFSNLGCFDGHLSVLQLVSRHVIENSGDRLKKASYGAPESGWPLSDSSWQCYYMLGTTTKLSTPSFLSFERLGSGLTVTEINIKKSTETRLKH